MGAELFDAFPEQVAQADALLGYSLRSLCLDGPIERLTRTCYTQPAIYAVCALGYLRRSAQEVAPDYLLGHSVGEYVALFASGTVSFETGLRLVIKRGELMDQAKNGGMAAVLGLEAPQISAILKRHNLTDIHPANFNTPRQIVLSGKRDAIEAAQPLFLEAGASHYIVLQVGGAFHTPFMNEARREFAAFAADIPFSSPNIPVISNVTARPHLASSIRERMVEQITAPVRWCDSIRYLLAKGARFEDFTEIGPEGPAIVKPMVKRIEIEAGPLDKEDLDAEETPPPPKAKTQPPTSGKATVSSGFASERLGSRAFCDDFGLRYPYVCGAMYQGISSADLVVRMGQAGMLAFFGAGGLRRDETLAAVADIKARLPEDAPFGVNFIAHLNHPHLEDELADLLLAEGVRTIEASAFMEITPALARYRAHGLENRSGKLIVARNRIIAKVSRPEVAAQFLAPAPERIISRLQESGSINADQAELLRHAPMADAICVESDSGGHTDQGMPFTLIPAVLRLRDQMTERFPRFGRVHVGAGGGIGTPEAAAAVLVLGAEFLLTGSINQCTVEARTSDAVKDMLENMGVQDTAYAPSGDMFELGSKVQVLKKGLFFPARAEKLAALYRQHDSLDAIDAATKRQIEERFFRKTFTDVYNDIRQSYSPADVERAERLPKHRMALVFKRYFKDASRWALSGEVERKVDFQIHCGPALGAFNQWIGESDLASWRNRHADDIALRLLDETAALLNDRFSSMMSAGPP